MKRSVFCTIVLTLLIPTMSQADNFITAPVMPGGKELISKPERLEKKYEAGFDQTVKFYQDALKDEQDVKFWDRTNEVYIEDHSNRPWHSITISKLPEGGTEVVTLKDNWTWIIGTLVLRFIAVFVVLLVLYLAMSISGSLISRALKAAPAAK